MPGERDIPFVDAHLHLWDLDRLRYPWLTPPFHDDVPGGSPEALARRYGVDEFRAEAAAWNVVGAVHVEAGAHADDALAETEWLESLAETHGLPNAIVAAVRLDDPAVDALLAAHAAHPRLRGIRHIVAWHPDPARSYHHADVTESDAWQRGFARLAQHGLIFDLLCYPGQMRAIAGVLARHPDTPVVLEHLGMPIPGDADGWAVWRDGMRALAALPQLVGVKLSGGGFIHRTVTAEALRAPVLEAIDIFGPERAMIASNFPTDRLFAGLDATLGTYRAIVSGFGEAERRAMWGRNADRIYRMGLGL